MLASRGEMAEVRHLGAGLVDPVQIELDIALMRDSRQMQHGIRGAAQRHIQTQRIMERRLGHDLIRRQAFLHHLHHAHARRAFEKSGLFCRQ